MISIGIVGTPVVILLIEDHPGDVRLLEEAFRASNRSIHLHVVSDGVEAIAFLKRDGPNFDAPRPDVIILDLNLPLMDGREVLAIIKADESLKAIPVVVLSTSEAEEDIVKSYQLQASCYYSKPVGLDAFIAVVKNLNDWLTKIKLPQKSKMHVLLVQNHSEDTKRLRTILNEEGSLNVNLTNACCLAEAAARLGEYIFDAIILDPELSDAQGLDAVRRVRVLAPQVPMVLLTGVDDDAMAEIVLQEGVQHYLLKNQIDARSLLLALRYSIERKAMEESLFAEKERAQVTLNSIGEAVVCTDRFGIITFLNGVAEKLTGWSRQEAAGRPAADILRILDAATEGTISYPIETVLDETRTADFPLNCTLVRRDGFEISIEDSVSPIRDREGQVTGAVIAFRDVSAARAMASQVAHAAGHDLLSGLPNRKLLKERIDYAIAIARRQMKRLAVLFLDLDGFKQINETLGHPIGDQLLQSVATRLTRCVCGTDTVSRQGGNEFIVLLSSVARPDEAAEAVLRILQAVEEPHLIDEHDLHVSGCVGVSIYPDDGLDAETLIKNAHTAMWSARETALHSYRFFEPAMHARAAERQFIEEGLRTALVRQEFTLHYQPKVDLKTGAITGAEALIRWSHPTGRAVPPDKFIPVAEACGLIMAIGSWVLRQACAQTMAWADAGLPAITIAVNVSAMELRNDNYAENLFAVLKETRLDPKSLVVELTESVLVTRAEAVSSILRTLRARGVQVAIDDFGTGYSSLSYLQKFPVDILKIDQSFVRQISADGINNHIVTAVIGMARNLKLHVIAEGVERLEELAFLQDHHCDEAQGYYFSRPLPPEEFAAVLATGVRMPVAIDHVQPPSVEGIEPAAASAI